MLAADLVKSDIAQAELGGEFRHRPVPGERVELLPSQLLKHASDLNISQWPQVSKISILLLALFELTSFARARML